MSHANKDPNDAYEASVKFIEDLTSKCDEVQAKVLDQIVTQNVGTEYLKRYGCIDRETFKSNVPLITYEDIKHDIQRIYDGDFSPILTTQPISEFWLSSGTSNGRRKTIPITEEEKERRRMMITNVVPFINRRIEGPEADKGKVFNLLFTRGEIVTPGGLSVTTIIASFLKDRKHYNDKPYPSNINTSPFEAIRCSDHFQSIYTQLLCGFYQRLEVIRVKAVFGSSLVWAVHFLKSHYSELCHDISSATLSSKITDTSLRDCVIKTFMDHPKPDLAKFIENLCTKGNLEGILKKIWPNAKYLDTVCAKITQDKGGPYRM